MPPTGDNRTIAITTPLGKDKLILRRFSYADSLGRPFQLEADLLSTDASLQFDQLVGQPVCLSLDLGGSQSRYFHGLVRSLAQGNPVGRYASYQASIVPWLWMLSRTSDCRIFQDKTIPDIIKTIFKEYGFSDVKDELTGSYQPWVYCVQYRETDFNFVSRLMEHEGIYYYWRHAKDKHELVLVDDVSAHQPYPGYDKLLFRPDHEGSSGGEYVFTWNFRQQLQPGIYALNDFNFEKSGASLQAKSALSQQQAGKKWEMYDYPGEYDVQNDGQGYAKLRIQELQAPYALFTGSSDAHGLAVGSTFELNEHPRSDQNQKYLVTGQHYSISDDQYESGGGTGISTHCSFDAMDATQQFRSPRITPKPIVQGPQTAIVVGPSGQEIYTDKYGRVKLHFHWDRHDQSDENSSCWVRVSQIWAGKKWGAMHIPRIGQEVVVEFLEGDPDQPIVTGGVYNDAQMPPYDLPANQTRSTNKSNSSMGGIGFNEVRFEDKKGAEQIFMHAERNMDVRVKNDSMERVYGNRHLVTGWEKDGGKGGDQREMVYQDKHLKVHRNQIEQIGDSMQLLVGGVGAGQGNLDIVLMGAKTESIQKDNNLHISGARNEQVDGDQSLTVGGSQQEKVGQKHAVDAGQEIHLKAGMKVVIEAGVQLTIKGAGGFIDIGPAGVTISGTMVLINSGGSAGSGSFAYPTTN